MPAPIVLPSAPLSRIKTPRAYVINDTPATMGQFHLRLHYIMLGTVLNCAINLVGDSDTLGIGGNYYRNCPGARLAARFRTDGFVVSDHKFGVYSSIAATMIFDPRFASFTGTWAAGQSLPGGNAFLCTSNAGKMTYNPSAITATSFDTAKLIWFRDTAPNGGGGDMTITVDGGATLFSCVNEAGSAAVSSGGAVLTFTTSQSGAASLQALLITVAAGQHTIEITNGATGNIEIFGIEVYNAATPTVFIRTMGWSGQTTSGYVASNIPVRLYETPIVAHLQIFCLVGNDAINGIALSTVTSNLATLKSSLLTYSNTSMLAWTPPPFAAATLAYATQRAYNNTFKTAMGSNVMIYDVNQRYLDLGGQELLALTLGGYYVDPIHLGGFGILDLMGGVYSTIMPLGGVN